MQIIFHHPKAATDELFLSLCNPKIGIALIQKTYIHFYASALS